MGLIKAALGAAGGVLADQWKEFFRCDSMGADVLAKKGERVAGGRSSNTRGTDNVITSGSVIVVSDGQCMMIVDQGKIVEFAAEPGEYTYDASTAPTIFSGGFGEGLKKSFAEFGRRFTFGGEPPRDQRVYFFNTKELVGNKYGTPSPVPFRVVDQRIGLDIDISVRCFGEYSYKLSDPILFYKNVCGNISGDFTRDALDSQLKTELLTAMGPAFARISEMGIRYSALPGHTMELTDALNRVLSSKWQELRGLTLVSMGISSIKASEEDEQRIKELQLALSSGNAAIARGRLVEAQAQAMSQAAQNPNGAMMGFMGMNMAQQAGGINAGQLFQMPDQPMAPVGNTAPAQGGWKCSCGATATGNFCPQCGSKKPAPQAAGSWRCACGATATGNFCPECGARKPASDSWTCGCGAVNKGRFCTQCGSRKPAGAPQYKCDKCGWEPEKGSPPPRFCPECGDRFDNDDII